MSYEDDRGMENVLNVSKFSKKKFLGRGMSIDTPQAQILICGWRKILSKSRFRRFFRVNFEWNHTSNEDILGMENVLNFPKRSTKGVWGVCGEYLHPLGTLKILTKIEISIKISNNCLNFTCFHGASFLKFTSFPVFPVLILWWWSRYVKCSPVLGD